MTDEFVELISSILILIFGGGIILVIQAGINGGDPGEVASTVSELAIPVMVLGIIGISIILLLRVILD